MSNISLIRQITDILHCNAKYNGLYKFKETFVTTTYFLKGFLRKRIAVLENRLNDKSDMYTIKIVDKNYEKELRNFCEANKIQLQIVDKSKLI